MSIFFFQCSHAATWKPSSSRNHGEPYLDTLCALAQATREIFTLFSNFRCYRLLLMYIDVYYYIYMYYYNIR